jgi:transaldolase
MTKLRRLFDDFGQSPWLDNVTREHLTSGKLEQLRAAGLRGETSNPTIIAFQVLRPEAAVPLVHVS